MTGQLAYLDLETTGLDASKHEIWEVGLIIDDVEWSWMLGVDLMNADPMALAVGRFHERHWQGNLSGSFYADPNTVKRVSPADDALTGENTPYGRSESSRGHIAARIARLTHGRHLVGAVVSFDEERLRKFMLGQGVQPSWHYHVVDVEALAAGWLAAGYDPTNPPHPDNPDKLSLPWKSNELSLAVGVDPAEFDRHTALGDCRWARAIYEEVMFPGMGGHRRLADVRSDGASIEGTT